jgi:hypothetical protein
VTDPSTEDRVYGRGRRAPAVGVMLRQELAFIKNFSSFELFLVFLRELRKAVAAVNKKKALAATKANATSASALQLHSPLLYSDMPPDPLPIG